TTAADVYGCGAILYALLTGRPPFRGDTVLQTLDHVRHCDPEPPRRRNPRLDGDLETICLKCLEKEPQRRYGSAEALADDLERWLGDEPILARPTNAWERTVKWTRRHPAIARLSLSLLLVFVFGFASVVWQWRRADKNAQESRQRLVQVSVASGTRLVEEGDLFGSLAWFADALSLDQGDKAKEEVHRLRQASILVQCPKPAQVFFHKEHIT